MSRMRASNNKINPHFLLAHQEKKTASATSIAGNITVGLTYMSAQNLVQGQWDIL